MRSTPILLASIAAACGGAAKSPTPALPAEPAAAQEAVQPAPAPATPPASVAVDATPDKPSGADAARDAELAKAAAAAVDAFVNSQAQFTRDGKRVVFVSDRDGLPQLYVADAARPDAAVTRLVTSSERVTGPVVLPDGKALVFQSDHGADENWTIFRVNLDGSGLVELTPGTKRQRDPAFIPDGKPDTIFYSGRAMSDVGTGIYMTSAKAPGEEKQLYRDDKPGALVDVSRDGKWGLFRRFPSRSENYLVAVDLATGAGKPVWPKTGKVTIHSASFSADGKRALISTDGGAEQGLLLSIDIASGKETARYVETRPATADTTGMAVALQGNSLALAIDAGNPQRRAHPRRDDAQAQGGGGAAARLRWRRPVHARRQAVQRHVVDPERAGGHSYRRGRDRQAQPAAQGTAAAARRAGADRGLDRRGRRLRPHQDPGQRVPAGGGQGQEAAGDRQLSRRPVRQLGDPVGGADPVLFLGLGYAWIEPNVRGSTGFGRAYEEADNGAKRLDAFKDIETTGRWAAAQPWADKDRVVVFGGSYGGYTVLVALTRMPDIWRAGVDLVGVVNLKTFMATTSGLIREIFLLEFGDPDKDAAFLESISPLRDADKIVDPLFVYAGANDPRVPRTESDQIVKALRARKVPVEYMVAGNEGHSLAHRETQVEFYSRAARFLEAHLK